MIPAGGPERPPTWSLEGTSEFAAALSTALERNHHRTSDLQLSGLYTNCARTVIAPAERWPMAQSSQSAASGGRWPLVARPESDAMRRHASAAAIRVGLGSELHNEIEDPPRWSVESRLL